MIKEEKQMVKELGRIGGFAYGEYSNLCVECKDEFKGDKRAFQCLQCAVRALLHTHDKAAEHEAQAKRIEVLESVLEDCREYFDNRADAEYFPSSAIPVVNEEMDYLVKIDTAQGKAE